MRRFTLAGLLLLLIAPSNAASAETVPLVLGADEDAEVMILHPRQVEEGPDGNLYVLDAGDSRIKVFSPDGSVLRTLAGEGEGPGLFQRVDGATFGCTPDGRLYFTEFIRGHRWITTMDLDGDDVRVVSPRLDVDFGVGRVAPQADGTYLVQLVYGSTPRTHRDYYLYDQPRALVRMDGEGGILCEIKRTETAELISYTPNGGTTTLPWTPSFAWCVLDERVIWGDGLSPELRLFARDGDDLGPLATPLPDPEPVTREDLKDWQDWRREMMSDRNPSWWHEYGRVAEDYDESLYDKPNLDRLTTTPAGNLLLEGPSGEGESGRAYWLLGPDGALITRVVVSAWRLHLSESFTLYFAADDEGATLVHALRRPADEAAALARVAAVVNGE